MSYMKGYRIVVPGCQEIRLEEFEVDETKLAEDEKLVKNKFKRNSIEEWKKTAEELNSIGERLRADGLTLSYHNHNFEFEKFEDKYGIEVLIENTDPENLKLEVDVFWIKFAGLDPAEFLKKYIDRINLIHLKDMKADKKTFAEVGEGIIDFKPVFEIGDSSSIVEWYIVEQDRCERLSIESARLSFENLRKMGRVE